MLILSDEWCDERAYNFDDYRAAQDAEEGAREHDSREYIAGDDGDDRDIPF